MDQLHGFLRKVVTIVLPGLATLYAILTPVWDLPTPVLILGVLAALALLGGLVMGIRDKIWSNSAAKYDGTLSIVGNDVDTGVPEIQLTITRDPNELMAKNVILFKSVDEREVI